ncbi:MAG: tetratricopeptide repeat protein, partial [Deltaproteobacteria bacterium]|nr:tetratricopeptide repeat protein [Deltaproteobacteria bacterium]
FSLAYVQAIFVLRKNRPVLLSLLWIMVPLLLVLYIPFASTGGFAERYLYLSSAGLALLTAHCLLKAFSFFVSIRGKLLVSVASVLILGTYTAQTIQRIPVWKDDYSLWTDAVQKTPDSAVAHYNLGLAYRDRGDLANSLYHLKRTVAIEPSHSFAYNNLANIYFLEGNLQDALTYYKRAVETDPANYAAHYNIGIIYDSWGRREEALREFETALRIKPDLTEARERLMKPSGQ